MKLIPVAGRGNEYLFTRSGSAIIWVSRSKKGFPRIQNSLFTESPIVAREKRDELFALKFDEKRSLSKKVKRLAWPLWEEWALTKSAKSEQTKDSIYYSSQHLKPFLEELYPDELNEFWWQNTYIPKKKLENRDRRFFNEWKWLSSFLKSLHRVGVISQQPMLANPDPGPAEGLFLEDSEIESLVESACEDLRLQIDLGFRHFMRRSEVLLLPWREIDFKNGLINLPAERTKIRKARSIPLAKDVLPALEARHSTLGGRFVFPSPQSQDKPIGRLGNATAWRAAIKRANKGKQKIDPTATFHDLRHSGLTRAFAATNKYAEICVVAGLSLEMAQRTYLHLQPEHYRFVAGLVK